MTRQIVTTVLWMITAIAARADESSLAPLVDSVQPRIVKIHGAGGFRRLEAYQSGFLISAEGHILTAWSHVLDADEVTATLNDGRRFPTLLIGVDHRLAVALLHVDASDLDHFRLRESPSATIGQRVLAFSNLFGVAAGNEAASVQHGVIAAVTSLSARSGAFDSPYQGPVYIVDAITNNPGAAGGALTNSRGELLGILGHELRAATSPIWINYAIPVNELKEAVDALRQGKETPNKSLLIAPEKPLTLRHLGLVLVPDVLPKTPPFIDAVEPEGPAAKAGLRPDDLIVYLNLQFIPSYKKLVLQLSKLEHDQPVHLTVIRGRKVIELTLTGKDR